MRRKTSIGQDSAVDPPGKRLSAAPSVPGSPASRNARAVPPVETSSKPRRTSPAPNSASPVLSETERSARLGTRLLSAAFAGSMRNGPAVGLDRQCARNRQADSSRQEPVLDRVDALEERLLGVAGQDRHRVLENDRARIERVGGEMENGRE